MKRFLIVWVLAMIAWNGTLWAGRAFGVHLTFGEMLIGGLAGGFAALVIAAGAES